ncbi:MAG: nucleotidyltransferase family protein [Burkholderiales bacterium]
MTVRGILLAAGFSRRFGANKLIQRLPDGTLVAVAAARNLAAALPGSLAVVRPGVPELEKALTDAGLTVTVCPDADRGMGSSLAHAVRAVGPIGGYVVALADMPFIQPETIRAVAEALEGGATVVAPRYAGERGHPVGLAGRFHAELVTLVGDEGARTIVRREEVTPVNCADPGVIRDIDTPADLPR